MKSQCIDAVESILLFAVKIHVKLESPTKKQMKPTREHSIRAILFSILVVVFWIEATANVSGGELIGRLLPGGSVTPASPVIVLLSPVGENDGWIQKASVSTGSTIRFRSGSFDKAVALLSPGETLRIKNQDQDSRLIFGYEGNVVRDRFILPVSGSSISFKVPENISSIKWVDQGSGQVFWVYITEALWSKTLSTPGEFRFTGTPDGHYEITVIDLSFRSISRNVQIREGRMVSILSFQQTDNGLSWVD